MQAAGNAHPVKSGLRTGPGLPSAMRFNARHLPALLPHDAVCFCAVYFCPPCAHALHGGLFFPLTTPPRAARHRNTQ